MGQNNALIDSSRNGNISDESSRKSEYNKNYMRDYRKRKVIRQVGFSQQAFDTIRRSAQKHHHNVTEHIRQCTLAYINQTVLVTSPADLQNLRYELHKIGVNFNQIAYKLNRDGSNHFDETYFLSLIQKLENTIEKYASNSLSKDQLQLVVQNSRLTLDQITELLQT